MHNVSGRCRMQLPPYSHSRNQNFESGAAQRANKQRCNHRHGLHTSKNEKLMFFISSPTPPLHPPCPLSSSASLVLPSRYAPSSLCISYCPSPRSPPDMSISNQSAWVCLLSLSPLAPIAQSFSSKRRLWSRLVSLHHSYLIVRPTSRPVPSSSAKDQLTGASVAIKKIMKPFSTPVLSKRTYRELKLLKHIQHENVRPVTPHPCYSSHSYRS